MSTGELPDFPTALAADSGHDHVTVVGPERVAASAFDVDGLLVDTAVHAVAGMDSVGVVRGAVAPERAIDRAHLLAYCTTHVAIDGQPVPAWADLSGVYRTADDREIQLHCNFAHHADGVVARLGGVAERDALAAAIAQRTAVDLESELIDAGMIAAAVRTLDEWNDHPHAHATSDLPLVTVEQIGDAPPRSRRALATDDDPLADVRVLDCSRVLAGPVGGQLLAGFGAEVLRLGADHLPSVPVGVMSTGFGKRNASADLRTADGRGTMGRLLAGADVWLDAYRPGAFASLGFTPESVAELRPGIVVVQISGFDWIGPWAGRRGFDSIVQSTTGVRHAGGVAAGSDVSVGLPVQALDYATGFLAADLAARLVAHQSVAGGSWLGRVSLLRTRDHLVGRGGPHQFVPAPIAVDPTWLHTVESDFGRLETVRPFAGSVGSPPQRLGSSPARWHDGSGADASSLVHR